MREAVEMLKRNLLIIIWVSMGILSRIIPHAPNFSPLISLSLFAGLLFPSLSASLLMLLVWLVSDAVLGIFFHYPLFGYWSLFTYTGMLAVVFFGYWKSTLNILPISIFSFTAGI